MMGSPENEVGRAADELQHRVELTEGYWLGDTPVTQALWEAVMGTNPSQFKGPNHPVDAISWDDCQVFFSRLNELVPGIGARFPTEPRWEYACRARTKTATWVGDLAPGQEVEASILDAIAWYSGNADGNMHPVATKLANPWGLYDMLGNVYEWCADQCNANTVQEHERPRRALRGGSWISLAGGVRAASRDKFYRGSRYGGVGLRIARNA